MIKFGLRIGNVGIEFPSIEDRQKAIAVFTKGTDVVINTRGVKYINGQGSFSVYDRDPKEVITICSVCDGNFLQDTCYQREYPHKPSYSNNWTTEHAFICEACYAQKVKMKDLFDAKKLLEKENE